MKQEKKNIIAELKTLDAKELLKLKNIDSDIPNQYFENLSKEIETKIELKPKQRFMKFVLPFSIAASILLAFGLFFFTINEQESAQWEALNKTDLENYIFNNIEDFSENEIAKVSNIKDISLLFSSSISEEALQDFLLENEIEEDELF